MVIPESYLMHHGVKGQKWGVRRYQNPDGTLTAAGRKRYGSEEVYNKAVAYKNADKAFNKSYRQYYNKSMQAYSLNKTKREANTERLSKALSDYDTLMETKKNYKNAKTEYRKEAVKKYQDAFNKHSAAQDKNDEAKLKVDELYKSLGRNRLSRVINAATGTSAEAKRYNKAADEWIDTQDKLDAEWDRISKMYRDTGRSRAEMVLNNIRYK